MKAGRPVPTLLLANDERDALRAWTRQPKCPQALALRARVVLLCADGLSNTEAAVELHITVQTVGKWRQRFIDKRLDGLLDEHRPGTPRKLSAAEASGLSRASVHRIWRAFSLQPHRAETFRLLRDSLLIDKSS